MIRFKYIPGFPEFSGNPVYIQEEYSFDFENISTGRDTSSLSIDTLQLELDIDTMMLLYVWGYHPYTTWERKKLFHPLISRGGVKVIIDSGTEQGVSINIDTWQSEKTFYDTDNNWICLGNPLTEIYDHAVMFATNTIACIEGESLSAIWIRSGKAILQ